MRLKLRLSVLLAVVGGLLVPAAIGSLLIVDYQKQALAQQLAADHARLTEILALGIEGSLWNMSPEVGRPLVLSVLGDTRVVKVGVRDNRTGPFLSEEKPERRKGTQFTLVRNVMRDGMPIGQVTVEIDSGQSDAELASARRLLLYTVLGQLLLSVLLIVGLINARLLAPIRRLTRESDKLARRELADPFVWRRDDELGNLGAGLERTRLALQSLFGELEATNRQLREDVAQRIAVEAELQRNREHLEERIEARTAELSVAKERAEVASQAKTAFLASISHELRTPLNAILGYTQVLRNDRSLSERAAGGLQTIEQSGELLLTLINDILDLSSIEAGKVELYPDSVGLAAFLRTIGDIIRIKTQEKDLQFEVIAAPDLPAAVQADEKRLRQVLLNLLSNAVKFTLAGKVSLEVSVLAQDTRSVRLRFEVVDSGIGIAADDLANLFQPFEQVPDARRRFGGTGLGLAISRRLLALMGSRIEVESVPGQGSRFRFDLELPIELGDVVEQAVLPRRQVSGYTGPRRKLLLVDDIEANRAPLVDFLGAIGFEVACADNGMAALQQAQTLQPDLILMDTVMPLMDGLEATRRLRQIPALRIVPVIAVSASASAADQRDSLAVGASAFLSKPIALPQLLAHMGALLGLEWVSRADDRADDAALPDPDALIAPPPQELELLYHLAQVGNMGSIRSQAERLAALDASYRPLARRLRHLADHFQSRAILELVKKFRTPPV
jgi:signal transduction histidine kinase/DNA-binding NarL/FixJ family response regulator